MAVVDRGNRPFDDDMIETALSGFDVEDWDWGTQDVCAEMIKQAAPNVKTLRLYWSGNAGVLDSWSASDGLVQLRELLEVTLVIGNTVQSHERTIRNIKNFARRLWSNDGKFRIIVEYPIAEVALPIKPEAERQREFLKTLSDIAINMKAFPNLKASKIALIEDGVEPTNEKVGLNIARGQSFVRFMDGRVPPWWHSRSGRGSAVAEILCDSANPVELYIARVDTNPDNPDAFLPSVLKAIRWAVALDVDIICLGGLPGIPCQTDAENARALAIELLEFTKKDIVLMSVLRSPLEFEDESQASHQRWEVADTLKGAGASFIATSNSKEGVADFLFPGQYTAPVVASNSYPTADLDADSVSLALATSLAAQILNWRREKQQKTREGKAPSCANHALSRVALVNETLKRLQDSTGNVRLDSYESWLATVDDAEAPGSSRASTTGHGNLSGYDPFLPVIH